MSGIKNFTFIALTYNHGLFILEHLESIKYAVETFGRGIDIDLIIADDASRDNTISLSKFWLERNAYLFKEITVLSDGINRGTCKNLTRALEFLTTDYCKITAGDDVFSFEDLFAELSAIDGKDIISGYPLNLVDGTLVSTRFDLFNLIATNVIYQDEKYQKRLKRINFFNSPSIVYATSALKNKAVLDFIEQFSVTEDYPLQIRMAELYKPLKYVQIEKIIVYYRRTSGSTYLTKSAEFFKDKLSIFNYLIQSESTLVGRFLLRNRSYCFKLENRYLRKVLNLNVYLYGIATVFHILKIMNNFLKFDTQLEKHRSHYAHIASRAKSYGV